MQELDEEFETVLQVDPDGDPPTAICGSKEVGALAHLYRAEVYRSTVWRQRLDQTTNWAVISTGIGTDNIDIVLNVVRSDVVQVNASGVAVVSDTPDIANARIAFAMLSS